MRNKFLAIIFGSLLILAGAFTVPPLVAKWTPPKNLAVEFHKSVTCLDSLIIVTGEDTLVVLGDTELGDDDQDLSISNDTLFITDGDEVVLPPIPGSTLEETADTSFVPDGYILVTIDDTVRKIPYINE